MLVALFIVILIFLLGGACMYFIATYREIGKKKDEFRSLDEVRKEEETP